MGLFVEEFEVGFDKENWKVILDHLNLARESIEDMIWNEMENVRYSKLVDEGDQLWKTMLRINRIARKTNLDNYHITYIDTQFEDTWKPDHEDDVKAFRWELEEDKITFYHREIQCEMLWDSFIECFDMDHFVIPFRDLYIKTSRKFVKHVWEQYEELFR